MAIPAYLWIKDEQGAAVKSTVTIKGREGSAEVLAFHHEIYIPSDKDSGALMGTRKHEAFIVRKQFCSASPILYKACCAGKTLQEISVAWYHIDKDGKEQEYFRHHLQQVKVVSIKPVVDNVKDQSKEHYGHLEEVAFRYGSIQWQYHDGNIVTQDSWQDHGA